MEIRMIEFANMLIQGITILMTVMLGFMFVVLVASILVTLKKTDASAEGPMASDGHRIPEGQDISCMQYGHKHEEFGTPRFIPHEDPEEGYIVLNGIKMGRNEAGKYQDRI